MESLNPFLVIGVGGSGGKTIRSMKQALRRRLDRKQYDGPLPTAWQFLQIDTVHDGLNFPAPMLPAEEVHVVVPPGADYERVRARLERYGQTEATTRELLSGWTVDSVPVSIQQGAGMLRGIGRSVGIADAKGMFDALRVAAGKLNSPSAISELAAVARVLGIKGEVGSTPNVVLVTSLSGGTGAGMFLDVAELFKLTGAENWRSEVLSFMYTPEVFDGLGSATGDVNKNALGAVNEIIAGNWAERTRTSTELLEKQGVLDNAVRKYLGAKGNILIGSRNAHGVDLSKDGDGLGMDEVFLTVGETLAGLFLSPWTLEQLYRYMLVNITEKPTVIDKSGLSSIRTVFEDAGYKAALPFGGMGFARLTLGLDRATDYVADAFTRAQIESLIWPDGPRAEAPRAGASRDSMVSEKVAELWSNFLQKSGVNERGDSDQVIDCLRPQDARAAAGAVATKVIQSAMSDKPRELAAVATLTWKSWEVESKDYFSVFQGQLNPLAQTWSQEIQQKFRDSVAEVLSVRGFRVTLGLLNELEQEVQTFGIPSLDREANEHRSFFSTVSFAAWQGKVAEIAKPLAGLSSQNNDVWNALRGLLVEALSAHTEYLVKDLGARLLRDWLDNCLRPLRAALELARKELVRQSTQAVLDNGQKNPLGLFPDWGSPVPQRYYPRSIERTLVMPDDYPSLYEKYAKADRAAMIDCFGVSMVSSLLGQPLRPAANVEQTLLSSLNPWIPAVAEASIPGQPASKASFDIASELSRRGELNRKWLTDPSSAFGQVAQLSIADYVFANGDETERRVRETRFADAYAEMMKLAQPLVKLNDGAMSLLRGTSDGAPPIEPQIETSKIPFAPVGIIGQRCTAAWKEFGENIADEGFAAKRFQPSDDTEIVAITATPGAFPAFAFASLTQPIASSAALAKTDSAIWQQFWKNRRTRPLMEAIPLPRPAVYSAITGWIIAGAFDLVRHEPSGLGPKLSIWNPTLPAAGWSDFPSPLLMASPADVEMNWWLPAVLQSVGLAMVDIGQTGQEHPAYAYRLLQYLGREVTVSTAGEVADTWSTALGDDLPKGVTAKCDFLKTWIHTGELQINGTWGNYAPGAIALDESATNATERRDALRRFVDEELSYWSTEFSKLETSQHWTAMPHTWELRREITQCLNQIQSFVGLVPDPGVRQRVR